MNVSVTDLADFEDELFTQDDILTWAQKDNGGGLPGVSAIPFASWLTEQWNEYDEGSGTQTNEDVLKGALDYWTGKS